MANFYPAILTNLCETVEVTPAVNQVELHPFFVQAAAMCDKHAQKMSLKEKLAAL